MDRISLFEELRLIERTESEVNGVWKGAHLLLFFLAFVFGSFCTFCFHMLMYLFEEKCVLFPKLLSLTSLRHNIIYEFIPEDKSRTDTLPVDFVSTQWVEKSACYLPTYVPLVSGIFGLVWTTMFLMCSTGSRTLTGLQRSWRVIPPVFIFSLAMGGLCIYSSAVTHYGLQELCVKLGEITGSSTCSYTVNVATLLYERKIRGVYQATRLTIITAWLHTGCWLASAALALARMLLAVDFRLVRVNVELVGDIDKMLQRNEQQLRTVSPNLHFDDDNNGFSPRLSAGSSTKMHYRNRTFDTESVAYDLANFNNAESDILYVSDRPPHESMLSLVPEEEKKLSRIEAYQSVPREMRFIVKMVYDLLDTMDLPETPPASLSTSSSIEIQNESTPISRQYGQQTISSKSPDIHRSDSKIQSFNVEEAEEVTKEIKRQLQKRQLKQLIEISFPEQTIEERDAPSTSKKKGHIAFESSMNITPEMRQTLEFNLEKSTEDIGAKQEEYKDVIKKKSNLKNVSIQTDKEKKKIKSSKHKVTISESRSTFIEKESDSTLESEKQSKDEETQTRPKEKQD